MIDDRWLSNLKPGEGEPKHMRVVDYSGAVFAPVLCLHAEQLMLLVAAQRFVEVAAEGPLKVIIQHAAFS